MTIALSSREDTDLARALTTRIEKAFQDSQLVFDRMDEDYDLWTLKKWQPAAEDSISPEDAYTTNAPRVLAQKIIAFIAGTELIIRVPNDDATEPQEKVNDTAETLAIGMMKAADDRLTRRGSPPLVDSLALFTTVRGHYAAVRALLRKGEEGTFADILPLDPRHLVIGWGEDEPTWAAYRMSWTKAELARMYPDYFPVQGDASLDVTPHFVYEYFEKVPARPNPMGVSPFERRKYQYVAGTICQNKFLKPLHDTFALHFPIVAVPVDAQPQLSPTEKGGDLSKDFGESIFAENRHVWDVLNRATSYTIDLTAKASDPRHKVRSSDGTMTLEEGATEKGAEIPLSTANQEDVESFQEADLNRAAGLMLELLKSDAVAGGMPPQAFGLLDRPLSAVALRQLGSNIEHRVMPRMRAITLAIEMSLSNLLEQYETGGFDPFPVSGRRLGGARFAGKLIEPQELIGRDPVEVSMQLALPEDLSTIWSIAQMSMSPTAAGEPLSSLEWTREHILRMPSHNIIRRQNLEVMARAQDPLAQTMELFNAALEAQDMPLASILYDKLRITALQRQVEGSMLLAQLGQMAAGLGIGPQIPGQPPVPQGFVNPQQSRNPGFGAPGIAQERGTGNQPSPEAGFNTTAPRNGQNPFGG